MAVIFVYFVLKSSLQKPEKPVDQSTCYHQMKKTGNYASLNNDGSGTIYYFRTCEKCGFKDSVLDTLGPNMRVIDRDYR
jgi:hypothetical protein